AGDAGNRGDRDEREGVPDEPAAAVPGGLGPQRERAAGGYRCVRERLGGEPGAGDAGWRFRRERPGHAGGCGGVCERVVRGVDERVLTFFTAEFAEGDRRG